MKPTTFPTASIRFDIIAGNPPYQKSDGGGGGSALPIYNLFVNQAIRLSPRYLVMIIPSKWFTGGRGLDKFRRDMLHDDRISSIRDFPASSDCFPGTRIQGGVCWFLWEREHHGQCNITTSLNGTTSTMERDLTEEGIDTFIRYNEAVPIYRKVAARKEKSFADIVSPSKTFGLGLRTYVAGKETRQGNDIKLYGNKAVTYIARDRITSRFDLVDRHKVYISSAYGAGESCPHQILNKPFYGEPGTACTETYLVIGPCDSREEAENIISYLSTRFLRFMVMILKNTQHTNRAVYRLVPMQDFSRPWTDEELYSKYGLTTEEITFIESMVRPMVLPADGIPPETHSKQSKEPPLTGEDVSEADREG